MHLQQSLVVPTLYLTECKAYHANMTAPRCADSLTHLDSLPIAGQCLCQIIRLRKNKPSPVFPHPYLWNLREEGKTVAQWWCFTHNPQPLWVHRLPLWNLPSHIGFTLRPITHTHTHSLKYYSSAWSAWMLDYCAVDRLVQLLDAAMRLCLHLRKTIQWNQSQWEVKIVPWWKCVGFKIEILDALRG